MPLAIGAFLPANGIAIERLGELEVAHVLRDDGQIVQMHGHARMIVAEYAPVDVQRALISLLGERPLLLARIHLREIVEHRGHVGLRARVSSPKCQGALV